MPKTMNKTMKQPIELTPAKAGELCGLSRMTIVRYIHEGFIKNVRTLPSGYHRIPLSSIKHLLVKQSA